MKDYYRILELPFGAASPDVKAAYRRLAFKFHPDKNLNDQYAEEKFKEITEAYSVLSNENRRIIYHAEFTAFLKNRYVNKIPEPTYRRPPYYHPADIPKQPKGPAASATISSDGLKIGILAILFIVLLNLVFFNRLRRIENEKKQKFEIKATPISAPAENTKELTKDEFYQVISQEFLRTGDSTLLNANIDSLKHVFDSLQQTSKY